VAKCCGRHIAADVGGNDDDDDDDDVMINTE